MNKQRKRKYKQLKKIFAVRDQLSKSYPHSVTVVSIVNYIENVHEYGLYLVDKLMIRRIIKKYFMQDI